MSIPKYGDHLRELIREPSNGLLLKARDYCGGMEPGTALGEVFFESAPGYYQESLVSLWELFGRTDIFPQFLDVAGSAIQEIRRKTAFSAIVTSSITASHLVDHLHSAIETEREKVKVRHLGVYPVLAPKSGELFDLKGEEVLIVSDVVSVASTVRDLSEFIERVGGKVVAIFTCVLTDKALIDSPLIRLDRRDSAIRVHSLTFYPIRAIVGEPLERSVIIKIDPSTNLPEEDHDRANLSFSPLFKEREMLNHFEGSKAVNFSYYQAGSRRFTSAIRLEPLLDQFGAEIWQKINPYFRRDSVYATTFNREDLRFKEFVLNYLKRSIDFVFVPRRDSLETPSSYFLLPRAARMVAGKRVTVLLSSVHTSEKLRNIVSLLASQACMDITVVCILNRMGPQTSDFIARIRKLLGATENGERRFRFVAVYCVPDLNSDSLTRMQQTLDTIFDFYKSSTRVPSFKRLMGQDGKHFEPHSTTSRTFRDARSRELPISFYVNGQEIQTLEGKLIVLCGQLLRSRDYAGFIETLSGLDDKDVIYKLFGILFSDLSYMRATGKFAMLRQTCIAEFRRLRSLRLACEGDRVGIERLIEVETYFLFGLALFSFLDQGFDYDELIIEVITGGIEFGNWRNFPQNFLSFYSEERVVWCVSMLLHLSSLEFSRSEAMTELKRSLRNIIEAILLELEAEFGDFKEDEQRIRASLSLLLTELGAHEFYQKHQVIRFLHSKVLSVKKGHSPIRSGLASALTMLEEAVDFGDDEALGEGTRIRLGDRAVKKKLEDAMYVAGILEEIAAAVRQLIAFAPVSRIPGDRYSKGVAFPGFAYDIVHLGDLIERVRVKNAVSKKDVATFATLRNRIFADLWDQHSLLRRLLLRYIVPVSEEISGIMLAVNESLKSDNMLTGLWDSELKKYRVSGEEYYVLIEPLIFREVVRNMLLNVRHSFKDLDLSGGLLSGRVSTSVRRLEFPAPSPEKGVKAFVQFQVVSLGSKFRALDQGSTLARQKDEVNSFGGRLEFEPIAHGMMVTLSLIERSFPQSE